MASVTLSSMMRSSPISFQDHDPLTLDLQPPPLRLPQRKVDPTFDGSASVHQEQTSEEPDDPFTSTTHSGPSTPPPHPVNTNVLSQNRTAAPKLDSLVSKFEILDAVNSAETSLSFKPKHNGIPGIQRASTRPNRSAESLRPVTSTVHTYGAARSSLDFPPRQVVSPPPSPIKSGPPVGTPLKSKLKKNNADANPHRHGNVGKDSIEGSSQSPTSRLSLGDCSPGNDSNHNITSRAGKHPG
ncbi:hypothetical protein F4821DRAFT_122328 [Hypoxylon rubiginosum]|uniref:Uncharacterized protein n=1 Tax=Hypoxylon rubiginosum TaxID=110542 RepID=A0ACC0D276_9PEZI|nr:hypothetical protein F4821DRAFT_122328 [Hypoxylon rubiginosum]